MSEQRAGFTAMKDGTAADWAIIGSHFMTFNQRLPDRVLAHLKLLEGDYGGFPIDRLQHSLQTATRAHRAGGEEIASRGLRFHYNAIAGLKVLTWSDRGLTYALVSDLEERGQKSCIVCHQGTKDQDFIEPLKPH